MSFAITLTNSWPSWSSRLNSSYHWPELLHFTWPHISWVRQNFSHILDLPWRQGAQRGSNSHNSPFWFGSTCMGPLDALCAMLSDPCTYRPFRAWNLWPVCYTSKFFPIGDSSSSWPIRMGIMELEPFGPSCLQGKIKYVGEVLTAQLIMRSGEMSSSGQVIRKFSLLDQRAGVRKGWWSSLSYPTSHPHPHPHQLEIVWWSSTVWKTIWASMEMPGTCTNSTGRAWSHNPSVDCSTWLNVWVVEHPFDITWINFDWKIFDTNDVKLGKPEGHARDHIFRSWLGK